MPKSDMAGAKELVDAYIATAQAIQCGDRVETGADGNDALLPRVQERDGWRK